jgi:hypothetical protein
MKRLKLYEDFKKNNGEGGLITEDDIRKCITKGGVIFATGVNKPAKSSEDERPTSKKPGEKDSLRPVSVEDKKVTVEWDNNEWEVDLENIKEIKF